MAEANVTHHWTLEAIIAFLEAHQVELRALGVARLGIFGSYVRDEQTMTSDLDVLVTMESWTWQRWCALWDFLEGYLGLRVDLVPEADLRPELRATVLREAHYVSFD